MSTQPSQTLSPTGGSGEMFDQIARRYDLLNRIMSFGADRRWRRKTVQALELASGHRVLDLATGTADLAIAVARADPDVSVIGLDPSKGMLYFGRRKIEQGGLLGRVVLEHGDAQDLPYEDDSFDGICMAFGIRNVLDRGRALAEMARVTRRDGRIVILELTEPRRGVLGPIARFHIHRVIPRLGALISGVSEYRYLERSISAFPAPEDFAQQMTESGLRVLSVQGLTFGVCSLFVATPQLHLEKKA